MQRPLVAYNTHIPSVTRVPRTPLFMKNKIRNVSEALSRRPSDFLIGAADVWRCPHAPCMFVIELARLGPDDLQTLQRVLADLVTQFTTEVDGNRGAERRFAREVVDVLALVHYEDAHLAAIGLRHVLHGQRDDGRVRSAVALRARLPDFLTQLAYHWEPRDLERMLFMNDVHGSQARHYEERCRANMQRSLGYEARMWAAETIHQTHKEEYDDRARTRQRLSNFTRIKFERLVNLNLDAVDGLFEPRSALYVGRGARSNIVQQPMVALNRLHRQVYKQDVVSGDSVVMQEKRVDRERRRAEALEQSIHWTTGEGAERTKLRG